MNFKLRNFFKQINLLSPSKLTNLGCTRSISQFNPIKNKIVEIKNPKILDDKNQVNSHSNLGEIEFIKKTYKWTTFSLIGTIVTSCSVLPIQLLIDPTPSGVAKMSLFGICLGVCGICGVSFIEPEIHSKIINDGITKTEYLYSTNNNIRTISYLSIILGMGMTMSPLMVYPAVQDILLPVIGTTGLIGYGSIKYFDKSIKNGKMELFGPALNGALYSLIACGIVGGGSHMLLGPNSLTHVLSQIDTYAGISLFTLLIAYDTWKAHECYKNKNPDHMGCSLNLYLDSLNILIRLMNVYLKIKDQK